MTSIYDSRPSNRDQHPLLKIIFIQRVLQFVRVDFGIFDTSQLACFLHLATVNTAWFETIKDYGAAANHQFEMAMQDAAQSWLLRNVCATATIRNIFWIRDALLRVGIPLVIVASPNEAAGDRVLSLQQHFNSLEDPLKRFIIASLELRSADDIPVVDSDLQKISSATLIALQKLNLSFCKQVTDNGLQYLTALINLRKLDLSNCEKITDNGLQHLSTLVKLEELDLSCCGEISDYGLQRLSSLINLRQLHLVSCTHNITDIGLQHLSSIVSLRQLDVRWCDRITDVGVQQLKVNLPKIEVLHFLH